MTDLLENELLENTHPGIMLQEDYLEPLGITAYRLAKATGLTQTHVSELLHGKRSITPTTSLLLGKFLGMSPRFWANLQSRHDFIEAERTNAERVEKVVPYNTHLVPA